MHRQNQRPAHVDVTSGRRSARVRPARRRSGWAALLATVAAATLAAGTTVGPGAAAAVPAPRVTTTVLPVPAGMDPSEPHLAIDPVDTSRLYAVVQAVPPDNLPKDLIWRTRDAGRTWSRSAPLGGAGNTEDGISGDPVVATTGRRVVQYGTLTFDFDVPAGIAVQRVGTRVSTDGGRTFTAFGTADTGHVPLCFFDGSCTSVPPGIVFLDKPWLAVDTSRGRHAGSAYLVWVRVHFDDGRHEVLVATSRDRGRTYGTPVVLDELDEATLNGLEELAQVVVRPDGAVDVIWNGVVAGAPVIRHAVSRDGGATFGTPERVLALRADASALGVVTSLAVSPRGRLGLCWSQARSPDSYDAQVGCTLSRSGGGWTASRPILPGEPDRQYLPAAAFAGERLWAAAYVSDARSTRLVAVPARGGGGFADPVLVNRWPVPADRICAPHPPDCLDTQTFIGDYIGLVATPHRVVAAYIEPSAAAGSANRVLVSVIG